MNIIYLGLFDDKFKYRIELNGHVFDYFTGLGWSSIRKRPNKEQYIPLNNVDKDKFLCSSVNRHLLKRGRAIQFERIYRQAPTELDVLRCLKSDAEAGQMSFKEFCWNFGYDDDSISALNVYRACEDTAEKLSGYKWPENIDEDAA